MATYDDFLSVLQGASNSAASTVSAPVDGINWILRKAGFPVSDAPVGGSDWLKQKGLMADPKNPTAGYIGEALGGVAPMLAAAKAPQIASAINQGFENIAAQPVLNKESGKFLISTPTKPDPRVGTRFDREYTGGLAEKTYFDPEQLRGSSLLIMPWDSTNRNMLVRSVSDVELANPVLTTGGQDFARDLKHVSAGIGGASNKDIAKRILDRARVAREENLARGGNGDVYMLPSTMGVGAENFSTMPSDILLGLLDKAKLKKSAITELDNEIRGKMIPKMMKVDGVKTRVNTVPFTGFKGLMTDEGRMQLLSGNGIDSTAGELRKALVDRLSLKKYQELLKYNHEDLVASITDPALAGVQKGYVGNTIIKATPDGKLLPSTHPAYDTDFSGQYVGSLLQNVPVEYAMPKVYAERAARHHGKKADLRNMAIGDLEKSKSGVSEFVDDQTLETLMEFMRRNQPMR